MSKIAIPINSEIIGEMFLRVGPSANITDWIENVVRDYLERTAADDWSEAYNSYRDSMVAPNAFAEEFGDPKGGYHWAPLFLPNGTLIRMEYKKQVSQAAVKKNKIDFDGANYSPSEFSSFVAAGTNRNAWRDLLIKLPGKTEWVLAEQLRRQLSK